MNFIFFYKMEPRFEMLSTSHVMAIILMVIAGFILFLMRWKIKKNENLEKTLRFGLATLLIAREIS